MPWVRKEDTYPRHRKIRRLNDAQYRMHDEAIHWCAEHLTDGHVPADELDDVTVVKNPRRHVPTLIQRGLWHAAGHDCPRCLQPTDPKGWVIHDYLEYNPTRLEVQAERARKREAGRQGGRASAAARRASRSVPEVPEAEGKQAASAPASALLSEGAEHPTRPVPYPNPQGSSNPEDPPNPPAEPGGRCAKHGDKPAPNCRGCGTNRRAVQAAADAPPPRPTWCGSCDETTRTLTAEAESSLDDVVVRCPDCHPLSQAVPA